MKVGGRGLRPAFIAFVGYLFAVGFAHCLVQRRQALYARLGGLRWGPHKPSQGSPGKKSPASPVSLFPHLYYIKPVARNDVKAGPSTTMLSYTKLGPPTVQVTYHTPTAQRQPRAPTRRRYNKHPVIYRSLSVCNPGLTANPMDASKTAP